MLRAEFEQVLQHEHRLRNLQQALQRIVAEGTSSLDRMRRLFIEKRGLPEAQINAEVAEIRSDRDRSLFIEDFGSIRSFYEEIESRMIQQGGTVVGMTDHDQRMAEIQEIQTLDIGAYVETNFHTELNTILNAPYNAATHNAFKDIVLAHILEKNSSMSPEDKMTVKNRLRNFFDVLRLAEGKEGNLSIAPEAIYGILGRVPSAEKMQEIFDGKMDAIQALPTGSIRVSFSDRSIDFYHQENAALPAAITGRMKEKIPYRILLVHYRPNADVTTLIEKMGDGQILEGELYEGKGSAKVTGLTGTPDCTVENLPAGVTKEAFLKEPMRYVKHDLAFSAGKGGSAI